MPRITAIPISLFITLPHVPFSIKYILCEKFYAYFCIESFFLIILSKKRIIFHKKVGVFLFRIVKTTKTYDEHYTLLLDDLTRTKNNLDSAYANFQNVVEPDLIDSYIYEVNAMQLRYKFLLRRVKQFEDSYTKNPLEMSGS